MQFTKLFGLLIISSLLFASCSDDDDSLIDPAQVANKKALGLSANDLLSSTRYTGLTIEMVSVRGFEPSATAVEGFKTFLEKHLHKPDGITIKQRSIPSSNFAPFSIDEVIQIENTTRTSFNAGDEITVFIYFADGRSAKDTDNNVTLGTAYLNTSLVIYEETIRELGNRSTGPTTSTIETTVLNHEFAHLLGLVNIGTSLQSQHEDTDHRGHCNVSGCLMEASIQFPGKMMEVLGNGVPVLDAQCKADLLANGGKP